jgi:hypothetical protein
MEAKILELLTKLKTNSITFSDVLSFIAEHYQHIPTAFKNGEASNAANENQGSAKVFAFAKINALNKEDTLLLFAEHYLSVIANADGSDHQNIRQFMNTGWEGIAFTGDALIGSSKLAGE